MNPQKLAKWKRWMGDASVDGSIEKELTDLALTRLVFAGVKEMVQDNEKLQRHSAFHSVFAANYAYAVLMYIRRQVRRHPDSVLLLGLLDDLHKNAHLVTRDYHVSLYTYESVAPFHLEDKKRRANTLFDIKFAGEAGDHLDPQIVAADIVDLEEIHKLSASFADRRVAHLDNRSPETIPTFGNLEEWCDTLNAKYRKYLLLLTASDLTRLTPSLSHDWKAIFRIPWLPSSSSE